jgi:class 3 adenylate cyclase
MARLTGSNDAASSRALEDESAEIRTFLIADVRGYTVFTQERGDEAAAKLARSSPRSLEKPSRLEAAT